jgi:heme-degrading monooxygenase HmoA
MANASRGTGDPVTMIATFTLTGDRGDFESALTDQAEVLSGFDGFLRSQVLRSRRRPDTYVNLGQWRAAADHLAAVRSGTFYLTYTILKELAELESDQAARVLGAGEPQPAGYDGLAAQGPTVLTRFHLREGTDSGLFEQRFVTHARFMRAQDGFIAHVLLRSVRHPGHFVNVGWWQEPAAYAAVVQSEEFQAGTRGIADLAHVDGDVFEVVANLVSDSAVSVATA